MIYPTVTWVEAAILLGIAVVLVALALSPLVVAFWYVKRRGHE